MTAINHALTGTLIAIVIPNVALALVVSFLSHIILDAMPHYGNDKMKLNSKKFKIILGLDIAACFVLSLLILLYIPRPFGVILCAFFATSLDSLWLRDFLLALDGKVKKKYGYVRTFLSDIQWSQTTRGKYVEIIFGLLVIVLIVIKI
ncbi:MAG: hypothetical protein NVSMB46_07720 [Candidatus Saccharimonadales bacterium]